MCCVRSDKCGLRPLTHTQTPTQTPRQALEDDLTEVVSAADQERAHTHMHTHTHSHTQTYTLQTTYQQAPEDDLAEAVSAADQERARASTHTHLYTLCKPHTNRPLRMIWQRRSQPRIRSARAPTVQSRRRGARLRRRATRCGGWQNRGQRAVARRRCRWVDSINCFQGV